MWTSTHNGCSPTDVRKIQHAEKCEKDQSCANAMEEGYGKLRIMVNGKELESVTQFCYLEVNVKKDITLHWQKKLLTRRKISCVDFLASS